MRMSQELDWSREEALRLDRVNQFLSKESSRLKAQLKSYEDDRELMVGLHAVPAFLCPPYLLYLLHPLLPCATLCCAIS